MLADTVASYLRRAAEWLADYRDASAKGRGTAANHLFYAGEGIMLAVLATERLHVGRGEQHQLGMAIRRLPDGNPMKAVMLRYEDLTRFATTFRYPTPSGRLKQAEDEQLKRYAEAVAEAHRLAVTSFGVDLTSMSNAPASHVKPLRQPSDAEPPDAGMRSPTGRDA